MKLLTLLGIFCLVPVIKGKPREQVYGEVFMYPLII